MFWDGIQSFFNYLAAFLLVLVLAYVTIRYGAFMLKPGMGRSNMKIIEKMPLDMRRGNNLYLVQVGEQYLLIGVSPGSVSLLTEIPPEELQKPDPEQLFPADGRKSFAEVMDYFKNRNKNRED